MPTHETRWPITDQSLTLTQLAAEASEELPDIIDRAHAVMMGAPVWHIEPGEHPQLVARTPVKTIPSDVRTNRAVKRTRRTQAMIQAHPGSAHAIAQSESIHAAILDLIDEHPRLSTWEIAHVLRISSRTVQRHMATIRQDVAA